MHKLEAGNIVKELDLNLKELRCDTMTSKDIIIKPENILLEGKGVVKLEITLDTSPFMEDDEVLVKGFRENNFLIIEKRKLETV